MYFAWINNNVFHKAGSHIIYGIAVIAGLTGCKLVWGISYKNKKEIPIHETQLVNYLTATHTDHGLLINFGGERIEIKRKFREYKHI